MGSRLRERFEFLNNIRVRRGMEYCGWIRIKVERSGGYFIQRERKALVGYQNGERPKLVDLTS